MTSPAPTLNMAEACALLGISTDTGYSLVRRNEFPAPVLRLGRTIRIPRAPLLALLGLTDIGRTTGEEFVDELLRGIDS